MSEKINRVLLIGSSGFVGSYIKKNLTKRNIYLLCPSSSELDITNEKSINNYFRNNDFEIVINSSGFADMFVAEKERGCKSKQTYLLNTTAASLITKYVKKHGRYLIHISTDAVFSGTKNFKGPYSEKTTPIEDTTNLSWYALTKLWGENEVLRIQGQSAIIRNSYPFGFQEHPKDYLSKTLNIIKHNIGLFDDFYFTPTFFPNLIELLEVLIKKRIPGIFHVATKPITTPFSFGEYLNEKLTITNKINKGSIIDFLKNEGQPKRNIYGGLDTTITEKTLKIKFTGWKEAIDKLTI